MPFEYQQYRNPYVGTISDLMMRPAEAQARASEQVAQARAQAAVQSGNAWAGAAQNVGQAVAAIPQQMQQAKQAQQQEVFRNAQIRDINAQEDQRRAAAHKQIGVDQQNAYIDQLMKTSLKTDPETGVSSFDRPAFEQGLVSGGQGHLYPALSETLDKLDQSASKRATEGRSMLAHSLLGIQQAGFTPDAALASIAYLKSNHLITDEHLQPIQQALSQDASPENIQRLVTTLGQGVPEFGALQAGEEKRTADLAKSKADTGHVTAETTKLNAEVAGTLPMTPAQLAANKIAQSQLDVSRGHLALDRQKATQADGDKTDLTPAGLDAAAMMFAKTGQLPALGMGDKTTRKAIINRAAVMVPGLDVASAKADFGANTGSLKNVTQTLDSLTAFENTAGKNLDQFLALAKDIPDTGMPWLNTPVRLLTSSMVGSENQAAANAARDVALREIARVTNDPKLSGVLSDSARQEVSALSPKNATFAQIRAVAKVLKQDMANVHTSLTDQRNAINDRIKLGSAVPPPTVPTAAPKSDPLGLFKP